MRTSISLFLVSFLLIANFEKTLADETIEEEEQKVEEHKVEEKASPNLDTDINEQIPSEIGRSPDAHTMLLFTERTGGRNELVAGQIVRLLIGFSNKGEKDFIVSHCESSFRYPLDFTYHIQNFSAVNYGRLVQPKQEATFDYAFVPSEGFVGRPLGLVVNLHYTDSEGSVFLSSVFNETITITEDDTSFQTETYFLYIILAGFVVFVLFIIQHFLSKFTRKSVPSYQLAYEVGTNKNQVDYEWIPRNHLEPKKSPKMGSPRNRKPLKSAS